MSLIKLSSFVNKILIVFGILIFFHSNVFSEESIDIWKKQKKETQQTNEQKRLEEKSQIDYLKEDKNLGQIKISENGKNTNEDIKLVGLYDPEKNDLSLNMWNKTDGSIIRETLKRIEKIKLSSFSETILINTIFTYSYGPQSNLPKDEFLKLKVDWLIKNNKTKLMEEFLNTNLNFSGKSKLIKHLVDYYIALADIKGSCEKVSLINKEIKDNYLDKFRIYCLILNNKNEEAQLNFDLLREEGRSDNFFNNNILFLLGINEKPNKKISDKNLLYFYLSSITVENFKYEPTEKTDKNIWRYLTASNLISTDKLEDPKVIARYEVAAHQGRFDKNKIFEIYLSVPFNIQQLINADTVYKSLIGHEARALIYQKILLSDDLENKLDLLFLLQDLFRKDKLDNIFKQYLSDTLKSIETEEIPDEYEKLVEKNIILEKSNELGKIKFDDKILHRSKVIKIFTEENPNQDKIKKDFASILKKISRNKKYFYSIKDIMLIETLSSEGIKMPKDFDTKTLSKNLTVPSNLRSLVDNEEIGIFMLKLVEIIGSDEIKNLDPETLYFITNLLNQAKIKKVRNQILNLSLPLRV